MTTSTALMTDFYEFTMLQAALQNGTAHRKSTFELFARSLPIGRRYGVVAGVDRAMQAILDFRFSEYQLESLAANPVITEETINYLRDYKFTGDVHGYQEGDVYFPHSPILTVTGTFAECVILETVLLSIYNHDSAVAGAASRMVEAAKGVPLIEMGSRRTHNASAVDASRAAYIAGFNATSNAEAGHRYGVPTTGTSAHAFTLLHDTELEAFQAQVDALGRDTTLLVDTYDTEQGIRNAVAVAGPELGGVRIDSGDLVEETFKARALLDSLGAKYTKIVLSSDIDEYTITELMRAGAPVDGVGAGTRVVTGSGHPTAKMVYKLVAREDNNGNMIPVAKKASGKNSIGGFKHPYRRFDDAGVMLEEFYVLDGDATPFDAAPVAKTFMKDGKLLFRPNLNESRAFHEAARASLPESALVVEDGAAAFNAYLMEPALEVI